MSQKKKQLFLHIGTDKTGSTTLQNFLALNRQRLEASGLLYPDPLCPYPDHSMLVPAARRSRALQNPSLDLGKEYGELYRQAIEESACESAVLSSEWLYFEHPEEYAYLLEGFEPRVVVYLRSYPSYFESHAQEYFKRPIGHSDEISPDLVPYNAHPRELRYERLRDMMERIERWIALLGPERCVFKNFDRLSRSGRLAEDFLDTVHPGCRADLLPLERMNASIKTRRLFFLMHSSFIPLEHATRWELSWAVQDQSRDDPSPVNRLTALDKRLPEGQDLRLLERQAELLEDPEWIANGLERASRLQECPYSSLPPEEQRAVFEGLPEHLRQALLDAWPQARDAGEDAPLLPDFPEAPEDRALLRVWQSVYAAQTRTEPGCCFLDNEIYHELLGGLLGEPYEPSPSAPGNPDRAWAEELLDELRRFNRAASTEGPFFDARTLAFLLRLSAAPLPGPVFWAVLREVAGWVSPRKAMSLDEARMGMPEARLALDEQHAFLERLPSHLREAVREAWPAIKDASGPLPQPPNDPRTAALLRVWRKALAERQQRCGTRIHNLRLSRLLEEASPALSTPALRIKRDLHLELRELDKAEEAGFAILSHPHAKAADERDVETYYKIGLELHKAGQFERARRIYLHTAQDARAGRKLAAWALFKVGELLLEQGEQHAARFFLYAALERNPEHAKAAIFLAPPEAPLQVCLAPDWDGDPGCIRAPMDPLDEGLWSYYFSRRSPDLVCLRLPAPSTMAEKPESDALEHLGRRLGDVLSSRLAATGAAKIKLSTGWEQAEADALLRGLLRQGLEFVSKTPLLHLRKRFGEESRPAGREARSA
jgi:hypothetical protein